MNGLVFAFAAVVLLIIAMVVYARTRGGSAPAGPGMGLGVACIPGGPPCDAPLVCRSAPPGGGDACLPPGSDPSGGGSPGGPRPGSAPPGCPAIAPGYGGEGDACKIPCECRVPFRCDLGAHKCVAGG
jgi:hypothetical protein